MQLNHVPRVFLKLTVGFIFVIVSAATMGQYDGDNAAQGKSAQLKTGPVNTELRFKPDELLVKFKPGVTSSQAVSALKSAQAKTTHTFKRPRSLAASPIDGWRLVKIGKGRKLKNVYAQLKKNPTVERVEFNTEIKTFQIPNDPRFSEQWPLHNTGQTYGTVDVDIDAPEAWSIITGADVVVGVIDTGIDYTHPDLAANIWTNPGEIPGNGIDDDNNGYIDDIHGYDFVNNDGDPMDDHGHGTHVAGTIAAVGNNGLGITGVNWRAKIAAIKFIGANGSGWTSDAIKSVLYASDMGINITNNSWGGGGYSDALKDAIDTAGANNGLFVAAAGNNYNNADYYPLYPAAYTSDNIISVAATNHFDQRAWFSNWGKKSVDLGAPGYAILSTVPTTGNSCCSDPTGYKILSGTSMASPHVAGSAALLLAQQPESTSANLKALLFETVDWTEEMAGITVTGGRLNVGNAVNCDSSQMHLSIPAPGRNFEVWSKETTALLVQISKCGDFVAGATVTTAFDNGDANLILYDDGEHQDGKANDGVYGNDWIPSTTGPLTITANATHTSYSPQAASVTGTLRDHVMYIKESAAYSWIDATAGTAYSLPDDGGKYIPIGFDFDFYGVIRNNLTISSNGFLSFGGFFDAYMFWNYPIPHSDIPNGFIAPHWDDLDPSSGGMVYSLLEGTAPNRRLTVAWVNVPKYLADSVEGITFEVTLYEGTNEVVFQYQDVEFSPVAGYWNNGGDATVGIENWKGTEGTQYSYNQAVLQANTAIKLKPKKYNYRPIAHAGGPYEGIVHQPIQFDGAASSDREGDPLTYTWNFGDGTTGTGATPSHTYSSKDVFTVELTVNDGVRDSYVATTTVNVPNHPPEVVIGGPYAGNAGVNIQFDSFATDIDGDELPYYRYSWDFGDGYSSYGANPTHSYFLPGEYTVKLSVYDGTDSTIVQTTATIINLPPVANAGPDQLIQRKDKNVFLKGSGSYDPEGKNIRYKWRQVSGPNVQITWDTFANPSYVLEKGLKAPVEWVFELTVRDILGSTSTDQVVITLTK